MDYDVTCLVMALASSRLNLIGFLIFCGVALCITRGTDGGGHHQTRSWAGVAHVAVTHQA